MQLKIGRQKTFYIGIVFFFFLIGLVTQLNSNYLYLSLCAMWKNRKLYLFISCFVWSCGKIEHLVKVCSRKDVSPFFVSLYLRFHSAIKRKSLRSAFQNGPICLSSIDDFGVSASIFDFTLGATCWTLISKVDTSHS